MNLTAFLQAQGVNITNIESWLAQNIRVKAWSKGSTLLAEGDMSQRVFYVEKGLIRSFYLKDDKDITQSFFTETMMVMPIECVFFNQKSQYFYETLEPSTVATFNFQDLIKLSNTNPEINHLEKMILYNAINRLLDTSYSLRFHSAKERYERMMQDYPDILLRAPLGDIASYLGITQQTLSVIRGQM